MNKYSLSILLTVFLTLPSFSLENPYSSGGDQYGNDSFDSSRNENIYSQSANSQVNNQSNSNNGVNQLNTSPLTSTNTSESSAQAAPTTNSSSTPTKTNPWNKVDTWIHRKNVSPTGQPDMDLANQRIQAGKARIKAIKAREKLDKHVADCKLRTEELSRELQKAEDQALFIENQVKFQEANAGTN